MEMIYNQHIHCVYDQYLTIDMSTLVKASVWFLLVVLAAGSLNDFLQSSMIDAGIISKQITFKDACKLQILPKWFEETLGCEEKKQPKVASPVSHKPKPKLKLNLGGDTLKKFKFEARDKTPIEKLTGLINDGFAYVQRLILPENFVMPCLIGDCNMDKKIKLEKEKYENLLSKKDQVHPPDEEAPKPTEPNSEDSTGNT
uniref:uncharacterized protein LOC104265625 n=1 Tax=Ciona intestinalis TaxID=7719 RepID=UPI000EF50DA5|nr:uncharacterized protein LOC104265625 [Ciona intestinalis]|eukprot:XP_009858366.3 uncharacterized protein LOC104265625 [Ciona intestinalis]